MIPPALSVIGPKVSMANTYPTVPSIPIVAIAVPYNPPIGSPALSTSPLARPR